MAAGILSSAHHCLFASSIPAIKPALWREAHGLYLYRLLLHYPSIPLLLWRLGGGLHVYLCYSRILISSATIVYVRLASRVSMPVERVLLTPSATIMKEEETDGAGALRSLFATLALRDGYQVAPLSIINLFAHSGGAFWRQHLAVSRAVCACYGLVLLEVSHSRDISGWAL